MVASNEMINSHRLQSRFFLFQKCKKIERFPSLTILKSEAPYCFLNFAVSIKIVSTGHGKQQITAIDVW